MRALWRAAATLKRTAPRGKARARAPTVFFITDPDRTPDPLSVAMTLPRGAGVIFRGFGRPGAEATARALAKTARSRGLILLIGADEKLADRVGADGVHLPERAFQRARVVRRRRPWWIITGAVHSQAALARAARLGLDAALASVIFPSNSPSAKAPLGPVRLALMAKGAGVPVYALGGVNGRTAKRLIGLGVSGFAAAEGLSGGRL
jgi:thiamine-phosphate pyrophosphorylase